MARVCPLCGEVIYQDESVRPHICKAIPMPTIGQCSKCGTALNDLNVSPLYPGMCLGCQNKLPGDRDRAIKLLVESGRILLPTVQQMVWVYIVSNDKFMLDLMVRSYGGSVTPHRYTMYKWKCYNRKGLRLVAHDLEQYNPQLSKDIMEYCREQDGFLRRMVADGMAEDYESRCLKLTAKKGG